MKIFELQSDHVIPFENKTPDIINELRSGIAKLAIEHDSVLCCTLKTKFKFVNADIENLLMYNFGTKEFKLHTKNGIVFKHVDNQPENSNVQYTYEMMDKLKLMEEPLCEYTFEMADSKNRFDYFFALRKVLINDFQYRNTEMLEDRHFKMMITVKVKDKNSYSIVNKVKPMLDGFTSALHKSLNLSKEEIDELLTRYQSFDGKYASIWNECLMPCKHALLPDHRFIFKVDYKNKKSIRMSPMDNLFNEIHIYVDEADVKNITFIVKVY